MRKYIEWDDIPRCQIPYFTARGWALLAVTGILGGIIGGMLFALFISQFSK